MKFSTFALVGLFVIGMLVLSGCVGNNGYSNNPPAGDTTVNSGDNMSSPDTVAQDLSGGTGSNSDDITTEDLDAMESDLDDIDSDTSAASQSDV